jgi:TetR/AcrR family fatty acid metabolism transcriptional regulator
MVWPVVQDHGGRVAKTDETEGRECMQAEQYLKRKERLLISAIRLLDEAGLAGMTTREMARREGITEPAVFRHFDGKVEVLQAILNRFSEFDASLENTVMENDMDPLDAITHIAEAYAGYYAGYPEIADVMFSMDIWKYDLSLDARMKEIFGNRRNLMRTLVDKAVMLGKIPGTIDAEAMAGLLSGIVISATQQWKMQGKSFDLRERVRRMLMLVLPGKSSVAVWGSP